MNRSLRGVGTGSALILLLLLAGAVSADRAPCATPETQGISVTTEVVCVGTVSNSVNLGWSISSGTLDGTLAAGETQSSMGYSEETMAVNGYTHYTKDFSVDTAGQNLIGNNIKSTRQVVFSAQLGGDGTGRMTSSEDIFLDGCGSSANAAEAYLCPFSVSGSSGVAPAYCNIVKAGSYVDVSEVSLVTTASARGVTQNADVPVALGYAIRAQGLTPTDPSSAAIGSISAYAAAHLMGGRGTTGQAGDLQYSEKTTASGIIPLFDKSFAYQSGSVRV